MSSKIDKERQKQVQEKCQALLSQMLRDEDNKYCVDCDAKGPRWASWNLGIFLCIRCAGIHRNLGVHISKVKSVNLDAWTPEQIACLQQMGNSRGRAVYEANLPDSFRRPQTDSSVVSSLEAFIRSKYEQKKYIAKEWVPPPMPKAAFELEDDKKKTKDRKSSRTSKPSGLELPPPASAAASRPKSSSSPSSLSSNVSNSSAKVDVKVSNVPPQSATMDLLGLDEPATQASPDDIFGGFLAADSSLTHGSDVNAFPPTSQPITNGEDTSNLFSQAVPDDSQKRQMSKESILSLYNQGPPIQQQPLLGVPGGVYVGQPQAFMGPIPTVVPGSMIAAATVPAMPINMIRGMATAPVMGDMQQLGIVGTNPFLAAPTCPPVGGMYTNMMHQPGFNQLQQQMASLSMNIPGYGGAMQPVAGPSAIPGLGTGLAWNGPQMGHTLSTNLWQ